MTGTAAAGRTADDLLKIIDGMVLVCGRTGDAFYDFEEQAEAFHRETRLGCRRRSRQDAPHSPPQRPGAREMAYARRKQKPFIPYYRGQSFRYFAVYRHPELDTSNTLAVSQDKVHVIKLPRRSLDKPGKPARDLTTIESRPIYGACLLKVPMFLALDRKMDFEWPEEQLKRQPWHGKDCRTYTRAERDEVNQFYEFHDAAREAVIRNGGGIRHEREAGGAYFGMGL